MNAILDLKKKKKTLSDVIRRADEYIQGNGCGIFSGPHRVAGISPEIARDFLFNVLHFYLLDGQGERETLFSVVVFARTFLR